MDAFFNLNIVFTGNHVGALYKLGILWQMLNLRIEGTCDEIDVEEVG